MLLTERVDGAEPALADVHEAVRRAWSEAQRRELSNAYYQSLLRKYVVIIESPSAAPGAQDTVAAR